jgi:hypothetical protein
MIEPHERKRRVKISRLNTLDGVASELAHIYRQSRWNQLDSSTAQRLAAILSIIARTIETSQLERRLNEIEQALLARERHSDLRWCDDL